MPDDTRVTWIAPGAPAPVGEIGLELPERYRTPELLGHGGMGEVWAVWDDTMERQVALKVLAPVLWADPTARRRFLAEARTMAILDHPDIVAVYDRGDLGDGAPFYTMRLVRGSTLGERREDALRTRLGFWVRTAEAIAYAHSRGVVHRDLKPDNVMVGPFGEVQIVDWGIAHHLDSSEPVLRGGTRGYMAPEQRAGAPPAPSADCFALGKLLLEMLGEAHELTGLAEQALGEPAERPTAMGLAESVRAWLDGARRRERAMEHLAEVDEFGREIGVRQARVEELLGEAAALLGALPRHATAADKAAAWALEEQAQGVRIDTALWDARRQQRLGAALALDPDSPGAHARLAAHHRAALIEAEGAGDLEGATRHGELFRAHGAHPDRVWLDSGGWVDLETSPPGARVSADRLEERGRRLVAVDTVELGITPLARAPLARGRWLLRVVHPDCEQVRYPVHIERGTHWDGIPPGASGPRSIDLPKKGSLGPQDCYVPGGWFFSGGDPAALEALSGRHLWVDGFVIRRHPVTHAQYDVFLNTLLDAGRGAEAEARVCRLAGGQGEPLQALVGGRYRSTRALDHPVVGISGHDARAYCRWLGEGWRLPHDQEWEKAARGVDGRTLPWGFENEASWTRRAESCSPPQLGSIGELGQDVSPYGVVGLAGNVADWCGNAFDKAGPPDGSRVLPFPADRGIWAVRGGHFMGGAARSRVTTRLGADCVRRLTGTGIRPVRSRVARP